MNHGCMPLFPPGCGPQNHLRMPLFGDGCGRCDRDCQRVRICNPNCPEEFAEVELCVDCDGNLSICVHRPPRPCLPPHRPRRGCGCSLWPK